MAQIQKWQKQSETIDPHKGGYSDMRLWPGYMISSILILTLSPIIGSFLAFSLVLTPALFIAVYAAKKENNNPQAIAKHQAKMDLVYGKIYDRPIVPRNVTTDKSAVQPDDIKETKIRDHKPITRLAPSFNS